MNTSDAIELCNEFLEELESPTAMEVPKLHYSPAYIPSRHGVGVLFFYGLDSDLHSLICAAARDVGKQLREKGLQPSYSALELPAGPDLSICQVQRGKGSVRIVSTETLLPEKVTVPSGWRRIREKFYNPATDKILCNVAVCQTLRVDVPTEQINYE